MGLREILTILIDRYTKALYHEYPIFDEDGTIIAIEWICAREGSVGRKNITHIDEGEDIEAINLHS